MEKGGMYDRHEGGLLIGAKAKLHHAGWMARRERKKKLVYVTPLLCNIFRA